MAKRTFETDVPIEFIEKYIDKSRWSNCDDELTMAEELQLISYRWIPHIENTDIIINEICRTGNLVSSTTPSLVRYYYNGNGWHN